MNTTPFDLTGRVTLVRDERLEEAGSMTEGPDGAVWFTVRSGIGRVSSDGALSFHPTHLSGLSDIAAGPDGGLWYTIPRWPAEVGRMTLDGHETEYTDSRIHEPSRITVGPDSALWFLDGDSLGRITVSGEITYYRDPGIRGPSAITRGPGRTRVRRAGGAPRRRDGPARPRGRRAARRPPASGGRRSASRSAPPRSPGLRGRRRAR